MPINWNERFPSYPKPLQSPSAARTSELGSHYEPGFAISGLSATILIVALVVADYKSSGIIDLSDYKSPEDGMCKILAMHAEIYELSADEIPLKCKEDATLYITNGQYARDLEFVIGFVVGYFSSFKPQADGLDIIVLDADDLFPHIPHDTSIIKSSFIMLGLYKTLQVQGWKLVLVSRKPIEDRNATVNYLVSSGYTDWLLLIMRSETSSSGYISRQRAKLEKEGKRIVGIVSSKMDALLSVAFSICTKTLLENGCEQVKCELMQFWQSYIQLTY